MAGISLILSLLLSLLPSAAAQLDDQEEKKLFRRYCLYAWGLPLVIVIVAILLDFSGTLEMGYGKKCLGVKNRILSLSETEIEPALGFL